MVDDIVNKVFLLQRSLVEEEYKVQVLQVIIHKDKAKDIPKQQEPTMSHLLMLGLHHIP